MKNREPYMPADILTWTGNPVEISSANESDAKPTRPVTSRSRQRLHQRTNVIPSSQSRVEEDHDAAETCPDKTCDDDRGHRETDGVETAANVVCRR